MAKWLGEPTDGQQPPMGIVSVGHCTEVERIASAVFSIISVREAIERKKSQEAMDISHKADHCHPAKVADLACLIYDSPSTLDYRAPS